MWREGERRGCREGERGALRPRGKVRGAPGVPGMLPPRRPHLPAGSAKLAAPLAPSPPGAAILPRPGGSPGGPCGVRRGRPRPPQPRPGPGAERAAAGRDPPRSAHRSRGEEEEEEEVEKGEEEGEKEEEESRGRGSFA